MKYIIDYGSNNCYVKLEYNEYYFTTLIYFIESDYLLISSKIEGNFDIGK